MKRTTLPLHLLLIQLLSAALLIATERPNVVWILSEDNSKHFLKLFDPAGAATPNIGRLAAEGLAFDHAFSCAPVCSVARTTLMSGIHAPRIGTQFHRKLEPVTLPAGWHLWPWYLRQAGYYTSNNAKTDYNTAGNEGVWNESSGKATWRRRPNPETPFFHMQTFGQSHESSLHFSSEEMATGKTVTDPASVKLAGYHPDTPTFRHTYARYHDRMSVIDEKVGELVEQLRADGLLEDTFIFYFGDHGGVLPGSKGYARETGLHVPLVVRVPDRWRHLAVAERGVRISGFVSFVDFGPTVLRLAGVTVPEHLDGRPFMGADVSLAEVDRRDTVFGYADRFDEKYDLVRTVRKGHFKYVRNFQAHYPDGLQNNYRYRNLAYQEWRALFRAGRLTPGQRAFFETKPAEALYDLKSDPYETRNLAGVKNHAETLAGLRTELTSQLKNWPDLSFFPESVLVEEAMSEPVAFGAAKRAEIAELIDTANLQLLPFAAAEPGLRSAMASGNPWKRYWGLIGCSVFGEAARPLAEQAKLLLTDPEPMVRVRAAEFLG
ncbi:MAG TPA: sulfatase, partial [Verrucomicrobiales bacterium]|nr:sulfatase [Verrucomicrobiales bacterium]